MTEYFSLKNDHAAKSSQKRTKEEETPETYDLLEKVETSASRTAKKSNRKDKSNDSIIIFLHS